MERFSYRLRGKLLNPRGRPESRQHRAEVDVTDAQCRPGRTELVPFQELVRTALVSENPDLRTPFSGLISRPGWQRVR